MQEALMYSGDPGPVVEMLRTLGKCGTKIMRWLVLGPQDVELSQVPRVKSWQRFYTD